MHCFRLVSRHHEVQFAACFEFAVLEGVVHIQRLTVDGYFFDVHVVWTVVLSRYREGARANVYRRFVEDWTTDAVGWIGWRDLVKASADIKYHADI